VDNHKADCGRVRFLGMEWQQCHSFTRQRTHRLTQLVCCKNAVDANGVPKTFLCPRRCSMPLAFGGTHRLRNPSAVNIWTFFFLAAGRAPSTAGGTPAATVP